MAIAARSTRPKVLVDGYFIDRAYGFGRYVRELVYALDRHATEVDLVVLVSPQQQALARQLLTRAQIALAPARFFPLWEQWAVPAAARSHGVQLVHFPYQTAALRWPAQASVMTLHDLIPHDPVPSGMKAIDQFAHLYRRWNWNLRGRRVARLLSVSPATRDEAARRFGVESVVATNVVEAFVALNPPRPETAAAAPYFLHRGGDAPHKNTERVLAAFAAVRARHPGVELRIFGLGEQGGRFGPPPRDGVHFLGPLDDAGLADLYRGALALVMPSLHEGFGLPIIEAFAFGSPVVTSSRPPMSDIASDGAGLLVDPESADAIRDAMLSLVDAPQVRQSLVAAARQVYRRYSGPSVAALVQSAYLDAAAALR